jgi:hypothetical protein
MRLGPNIGRPSMTNVGTLPCGFSAWNSGGSWVRSSSEITLPSNTAPTSCKAICTAIELDPGA